MLKPNKQQFIFTYGNNEPLKWPVCNPFTQSCFGDWVPKIFNFSLWNCRIWPSTMQLRIILICPSQGLNSYLWDCKSTCYQLSHPCNLHVSNWAVLTFPGFIYFLILFHFPFQLNPNDYSISLISRFVGSVVSPLSYLNDTKFSSLFGFKYRRIRVVSQIFWSRWSRCWIHPIPLLFAWNVAHHCKLKDHEINQLKDATKPVWPKHTLNNLTHLRHYVRYLCMYSFLKRSFRQDIDSYLPWNPKIN